MEKEEIRENVRKIYKEAFRTEPSEWYLERMVEIIVKNPSELNGRK